MTDPKMKECGHCRGRGTVSKYDQGWRSLAHDPALARQQTCFFCAGLGRVPDIRPAAC